MSMKRLGTMSEAGSKLGELLFFSVDALTLDATARLTNVQFSADLQNISSQAYANLTGGILAEVRGRLMKTYQNVAQALSFLFLLVTRSTGLCLQRLKPCGSQGRSELRSEAFLLAAW